MKQIKSANPAGWHTPASPTSLQDLRFYSGTNTPVYDQLGNILYIYDWKAGAPQTQAFSYDNLNRLVSASASGGTGGLYSENYSYHPDTGNLYTKSGLGTYTYSSTHKHAVASISNGWSFQYDANGNMTQRVAGGTYNLAYDAENRLTSVSGAATATFVYDGDGNRVKATADGVTTTYIGNYYELASAASPSIALTLDNPGFESDDSWSQKPSSSYPGTSFFRSTWGTAAPHSGSYGDVISNQAYGYLQSDAIAVSAGSQYDLYAWVRGELDVEDSERGWIVRAVYYNSSGGQIGTQDAAISGPGSLNPSWQQVGGRITTPANTATMRIALYSYMNSGWVAFDDISLVRVGTSTNLAPNPGFESAANWSEVRASGYPGTSFFRSTWGTATPHGGSYAYAISDQAYGCLATSGISVLPGTAYEVSAWVRGELDPEDSAGSWIVRVYFRDGSGASLGYVNVARGEAGTLSTTWQEAVGQVTTPANTATIDLQLMNFMNTGWVAWDDVAVKQAGTSANLVSNAGFETTGGWSEVRVGAFPGTSFNRSTGGTAAPHSGSYAYNISNHAYGYLESNPQGVEGGQPYAVSAWVRGELDDEGGQGGWILRVAYYNASGVYLSYQNAASGASGSLSPSWQSVGGQVTAPADAASMRLQLYQYQSSGWVAWDDVVVEAQRVVTKYYYAGATRVAQRTGGQAQGEAGLRWLLSDHLGSTSRVATASGAAQSELRYRAWGEVRYSSGTPPTKYTYTGQYSDSYINLLWYGSRWYDSQLGRFVSPDSIVPGVGEGGNPNAVGYCGSSIYSPLIVDYHENQLLAQLNSENRARFQDPDFKLPPVPTISIAFDRYAYSLNNPIRFTDPTGHCPFCAAIALTLGAVTPAGWVVLGVATVATVAFVATGGPEAFGEALYQAGEAVTNGINVAFHKKDWIPDNLLPQNRGRFKDAAEKYKSAYPGLPRGFQLPKELARELADLLNEGLSVEDAVDAMPELDDAIDGSDED